MALTEDQRVQCIRELIRSIEPAPVNFTRAQLKATVDAVDQWCSDNAASFNSALPQPFRGQATAQQKAALLASVALRRFGL